MWAGIHHDGRTAVVYRDEILQLVASFSMTMPGHTLHESAEIGSQSSSEEPSITNSTGTGLGATEWMAKHPPKRSKILLPPQGHNRY